MRPIVWRTLIEKMEKNKAFDTTKLQSSLKQLRVPKL